MPEATPPTDPLSATARTLLTKTLRLRRGESVMIETWSHTLQWARALSIEARSLGVRPMVVYEDDQAWWAALDRGLAKDVGKVGPSEWAALGKASGYVFMWGPEDRARYSGLEPGVRDAATSYNGDWYDRANKAHVRGCRLEIARATASEATRFGVSHAAWQDELLRASAADPTPLSRVGARVAARLQNGRAVSITHANGTSLELKLARRKPFVDDGIVDERDVRAGRNMTTVPGGVVTVAVDESFGEGRFVSNKRCYYNRGAVAGGQWTFSGGKLTEFSYAEGQDYFAGPYEREETGRDQFGFLSIGLNPELRSAPRLEDQEMGAVSIALGNNVDLGGKNKAEFGAWLSLAAAHVSVDGKPLVADGVVL